MNALYSWLHITPSMGGGKEWVISDTARETETPWNTTEEDKDGMQEVTEDIADG